MDFFLAAKSCQEGHFLQPTKGQSLIHFLSSHDFQTCANLDKVRLHKCKTQVETTYMLGQRTHKNLFLLNTNSLYVPYILIGNLKEFCKIP